LGGTRITVPSKVPFIWIAHACSGLHNQTVFVEHLICPFIIVLMLINGRLKKRGIFTGKASLDQPKLFGARKATGQSSGTFWSRKLERLIELDTVRRHLIDKSFVDRQLIDYDNLSTGLGWLQLVDDNSSNHHHPPKLNCESKSLSD
jgi:hypothetical protein